MSPARRRRHGFVIFWKGTRIWRCVVGPTADRAEAEAEALKLAAQVTGRPEAELEALHESNVLGTKGKKR
jgi:Spy/CpxP family protein refolding chaperone